MVVLEVIKDCSQTFAGWLKCHTRVNSDLTGDGGKVESKDSHPAEPLKGNRRFWRWELGAIGIPKLASCLLAFLVPLEGAIEEPFLRPEAQFDFHRSCWIVHSRASRW